MIAPNSSALFRWLRNHWLITFLLMTTAFVLFGLSSLNLVQVFSANLGFLLMHGEDAVRDGALRQLAELIASAVLAVVFYLLFKLCEHVLVHRASNHNPKDQP